MKILTPLTHLKNLLKRFDQVLVLLDKCEDDFIHVNFSKDGLNSFTEIDKSNKEEIAELKLLLEGYVLLSDHLLNHPLINTIRHLRGDNPKFVDPRIRFKREDFITDSIWVNRHNGTRVKVIKTLKGLDRKYLQFVIVQYIQSPQYNGGDKHEDNVELCIETELFIKDYVLMELSPKMKETIKSDKGA